MKNNLETITNLFEKKEIRSIWDKEKEDYYFSVVDVISALTGNDYEKSRNYWKWLKNKLINEGSELVRNTNQLRIKSNRDGKKYLTDVLDTEGILRLIETVPSKKAEPFKLWLAHLGKREIDSVFDPSVGIDKMIDFYLAKGYSLDWIKTRVNAIADRKELVLNWKESGINEDIEFAILTNEIYKSWSDMDAKEYKKYKGLKKENLRDNMSRMEVILTDLGEEATKELIKTFNPSNLKENINVAKMGGNVARSARNNLEEKIGKSIVTKDNKILKEGDKHLEINNN